MNVSVVAHGRSEGPGLSGTVCPALGKRVTSRCRRSYRSVTRLIEITASTLLCYYLSKILPFVIWLSIQIFPQSEGMWSSWSGPLDQPLTDLGVRGLGGGPGSAPHCQSLRQPHPGLLQGPPAAAAPGHEGRDEVPRGEEILPKR